MALWRLGVPKKIARKDGVHAKTLRRQGRGWAAVRLFLVPRSLLLVGAMLLFASVCIKWGHHPKGGYAKRVGRVIYISHLTIYLLN